MLPIAPYKPHHPSFFRQLDPTFFGYIGLLGYGEVFFARFIYFYLLFLLFFYPVVEYVAAIPAVIRQLRSTKNGKVRYLFVNLKVRLKSLFGQVINPFMLLTAVKQYIAETILALQFLFLRPNLFRQAEQLSFALPFQGRWVVVNGGINRKTSHSWRILNQRYAYDFVAQGDEGIFTTGSKSLDACISFGQEIYAPASGLVIRVHDGCRDYPKTNDIDLFARGTSGNYVMIAHKKGCVSKLAHLQKGSIRVKKGDMVQQGEMIGCCGNSGNSTQPHLHFQVQTSPIPLFGFSLPIVWQQVNAEEGGTRRKLVENYIQQGMVVENAHDQ